MKIKNVNKIGSFMVFVMLGFIITVMYYGIGWVKASLIIGAISWLLIALYLSTKE